MAQVCCRESADAVSHFFSFSDSGLFSTMTDSRLKIVFITSTQESGICKKIVVIDVKC